MPGIVGFIAKPDLAKRGNELAMAMAQRLTHRPEHHTRITRMDSAFFGIAGADKTLARNWPAESDTRTPLFVAIDGSIRTYGRYEDSTTLRGAASDADKILALYEDGEKDFYKNLDGAFSFALWDGREKTLTLGRDRYGRRPLYYAEPTFSTHIAFGSELKSLLCHADLSTEMDAIAPLEWLIFGHLLGDRTWLRRIRLLSPGTVLRWRDGRAKPERYFQYSFTDPTFGGSTEEAAVDLVGRLTAAVASAGEKASDVHMLVGGGFNSRALLAFGSVCSGLSPKAHTFGLRGADDVLCGQLSAQLAGVEWDSEPVDEENIWKNTQETVYLSDGEVGLEDVGYRLLMRRLGGTNPVAILGSGGGIVLGSEHDRPLVSARFDRDYLRAFWKTHTQAIQTLSIRDCFQPDVVRQLPLDDLVDYLQGLYVDCPFHEAWQADLFFRTHHERRRDEGVAHLLRTRVETVNPFFQPEVEEFGFHLPMLLRRNRTLFSEALKLVNPKLNLLRDVPNPWRWDASSAASYWLRKPLRDRVEGLISTNEEALSAYFDTRYLQDAVVAHGEGRINHSRLLLTTVQAAMVLKTLALNRDYGATLAEASMG